MTAMENMECILKNGVFYINVLVFSFLHECAHGLAAARAGGGGRMNCRWVMGNVLYLEPGLSPGRRTVVYAAGPLFNVASAAAGTAAALFVRENGHQYSNFLLFMHLRPQLVQTVIYNELVMLVYANVMLAAFNMLPFYPLDGGRIAVLLLSGATGRKTAARIACVFSILFAVSIFFLGLYLVKYNIMNIILTADAFYFIYIFEREINEIL